jgi:hypothetical protein
MFKSIFVTLMSNFQRHVKAREFGREGRESWLARREVEFYTPIVRSAPLGDFKKRWTRDVEDTSKRSSHYSVVGNRDLQDRDIGDWFRNLGSKIKGGLSTAETWLGNNWQTVAGVVAKFIP